MTVLIGAWFVCCIYLLLGYGRFTAFSGPTTSHPYCSDGGPGGRRPRGGRARSGWCGTRRGVTHGLERHVCAARVQHRSNRAVRYRYYINYFMNFGPCLTDFYGWYPPLTRRVSYASKALFIYLFIICLFIRPLLHRMLNFCIFLYISGLVFD